MKLFTTLLIFAVVVALSLAQNGQSDLIVDDSQRISMCGNRLSNILIMVCRPFGGIARRKRSGSPANPISAYMWHRSTRELVCSKPTQSAPCFCCSKFYGPCTLKTLIANFCAEPTPEYDRYFIKT